MPKSRPVIAYKPDGSFCWFPSITAASEHTGANPGAINNAMKQGNQSKRGRRTAGGWCWKHAPATSIADQMQAIEFQANRLRFLYRNIISGAWQDEESKWTHDTLQSAIKTLEQLTGLPNDQSYHRRY